MKTIITKSVSQVDDVASYVLDNLTRSRLILLKGDLGSGKTTLVKFLAKKLNIIDTITSPTFNYMKVYDGLIHIDAYHLSGDLSEFEDYYQDNVVAIEWANNIDTFYDNYIDVNISVDINGNHIFKISIVKGEKWNFI